MYQEVLKLWFEDIDPKMWWSAEPAFDDLIRQKYEGLFQQAASGELYAWRMEARGRLAEIIVLDQFSRNMYRNSPRAFSQDTVALVLAQEAVALGMHHQFSPVERSFLFLPYMHSESRLIHVMAERLYREFALPINLEFELRHKAIVDRFGRYPHRNESLGRASTPEEMEFLKQPGSSF